MTAATLGALRVEKTLRVIDRTEVAVLVLDPQQAPDAYEEELLARLRAARAPGGGGGEQGRLAG